MPEAALVHTVAVCSWSLRPHSPTELVRLVRATGVGAVQLALDPIARGQWREDDTFRQLRGAGIRVVSGMLAPAGEDYSTLETIRATGGVRPAATWMQNLRAAEQIADICARHALPLCTFHAGHVPAEGQEREVMLSRLARMCTPFLTRGVAVAFETGQEMPADQAKILAELRSRLERDGLDAKSVGLNFDPANIILYGVGDPMAAFAELRGLTRQVHIKDARRTTTPGTWGQEVAAGDGDVPWPLFLAAVHEANAGMTLVIEREAGEARVQDVVRARMLLETVLGETMAPAGAGRSHG